jgi:surface antigen
MIALCPDLRRYTVNTVRFHWRKLLASCCIIVAFVLLSGDVIQVVPKNAPVASPSAGVGPTQVQAPKGYAYGYGTYYVSLRRTVAPNWGDARNWYQHAQTSGFAVGAKPAKGAIAWTNQGSFFGHVAYVEEVAGSHVTVSEMYYKGNWNRVTFRTVSSNSFLYIY